MASLSNSGKAHPRLGSEHRAAIGALLGEEVAAVTYTVVFHLDASGWWFAEVPELPGCHTQGRTVDQARVRIREAIAVWLGAPDDAFAIRDDIRYSEAS